MTKSCGKQKYWDYFRAFWHFEDIMNEIKPDVT